MSVETGACAAWGKKSTRRRLTSEQDRQAVREAAPVTRTAPQPEKRTSPLPARLTFFSPNSKPAFLVELQTAAQYLLLNNVKDLSLIKMIQKLFIIFRKVLKGLLTAPGNRTYFRFPL